jgi:transposase InsO family protein
MKVNRCGVLQISTLIFLWSLVIAPVVPQMAKAWLDHSDNSHAILVPFICLYFGWAKRREFVSVKFDDPLWGSTFLVLCLALYLLSYIGGFVFGVRLMIVGSLIGLVWLFTAVEHWNAECVGWHVAKTGDRFAALQPLSMGLKQRCGSVGEDVARDLILRMDNGSLYLSEHFQNQIKFWGMAPSFAFVAQPETNGVVERFKKTLKEQIVHGRLCRNIGELRAAAGAIVETYNRHWLIEKLGFKSPWQARQEFDNQLLKVAA